MLIIRIITSIVRVELRETEKVTQKVVVLRRNKEDRHKALTWGYENRTRHSRWHQNVAAMFEYWRHHQTGARPAIWASAKQTHTAVCESPHFRFLRAQSPFQLEDC